MKHFWHVPWLLCTLLASFFIIQALDPFAGQGTGLLIATLFGSLAVTHLIAGGLGFFLSRRTWWRLLVVILVALLPTILFAISKAEDAWYLRYQAVYDRFRENVANPIPASVADLQIINLDESHSTDLMFRFTIAPQDLANIIRTRGFTRIDTTQFRQPDDLFTHPEYLPLAEPATYYVINDIKAGYPDKGIGEGYTLKVSADGTHVIFRRESAAYYLYKYWESDSEKTLAQDFYNSLGPRKSDKPATTAAIGNAP